MENLKVSFVKEEVYDFGANLDEDSDTLNNQLRDRNSDSSDTSDTECARVYNEFGSARSGGPQADQPPPEAAARVLECQGQGDNHTPNPAVLRQVSRTGRWLCDGGWETGMFCEGCSCSQWCPYHGQGGSQYCQFGICKAAKHGKKHIKEETALLQRKCVRKKEKPALWVCSGCRCPYSPLCRCNDRK